MWCPLSVDGRCHTWRVLRFRQQHRYFPCGWPMPHDPLFFGLRCYSVDQGVCYAIVGSMSGLFRFWAVHEHVQDGFFVFLAQRAFGARGPFLVPFHDGGRGPLSHRPLVVRVRVWPVPPLPGCTSRCLAWLLVAGGGWCVVLEWCGRDAWLLRTSHAG
eukprot:3287611-Rhodomonas_salina.1